MHPNGPPAPLALRALTLLAVLATAPGSASASEPASLELRRDDEAVVGARARVPAEQARSKLRAWRRELAETRDRLDEAYGYEGAQRRAAEALRDAGLTPEGGEAPGWSSALHGRWQRLRPFAQRHVDALEAAADTVAEQGFALAVDLRWLRQRATRTHETLGELERGLEVWLDLRVRRAEVEAELEAAQDRREDDRELLQRLGGPDASAGDRLRALRGRASALAASAEWLGSSLERTASKQLLEPPAPLAERPRHVVGPLRLRPEEAADPPGAANQGEKDADPPGAANQGEKDVGDKDEGGESSEESPDASSSEERREASSRAASSEGPSGGSDARSSPRPGTRSGLLLAGAAAAHDVERSREAMEARSADRVERHERVRTLRQRLDEVNRPADLVEVRERMAEKRQLEAEIASLEERIQQLDLEEPGAEQQSRKLAERLASRREELEPLEEELTRLRSEEHMRSWRKETRRELAAAVEGLADARRSELRTLARIERGARELMQARARRYVHDARRLRRRIAELREERARLPALRAVELRAAEERVYEARRVSEELLDRREAALAEAEEPPRALHSAVEELTGAAGALVEAGLARIRAAPDRGGVAVPAGLAEARDRLAERLRAACAPEPRKTYEAAHEAVAALAPRPRAVLRARGRRLARRALKTWRGDASAPDAPGESAPSASALAEAAGSSPTERLGGGSAWREAASSVEPPPSVLSEARSAASSDAEKPPPGYASWLRGLVALPILRATEDRLHAAVALLSRRVRGAREALAPYREPGGFHVTARRRFLDGIPVTLHVEWRGEAPLRASLGGRSLPRREGEGFGLPRFEAGDEVTGAPLELLLTPR